ncbi:MAG: hypothetical protein HOP17_02765 [Acidobacteria bacterium]|nr:hypothetical protein [Acidobacteriota bacterium]
MLLAPSIYAQQKNVAIGWDLTYKSVLERNNVAKTEWIWPWLAQYKTPAEKWLAGWKGEPIVSSMLIEHPAFHAAEHTTMWLIRTEDEAFYWESVAGSKNIGYEEPIAPTVYDAFYKEASAWQQFRPKRASALKTGALTGYMGFLSVYGPDGSRQMLLTMDDFSVCLDKSCTPGKSVKPGRLIAALVPILIPESERNYKHKSEPEIAAMTPEQRIDEEIKERDHMSRIGDRQYGLILKYRRKDGLKGHAHLIKLIESYDPKRLRNHTYSAAVMIALDIDDRTVRLRGSPEGRKIIEAIERLSSRMKMAGEKYITPDEMDLPKLNGLNFVDHAIADTLWMKYRIQVSDSELLEFSNFLVSRDPTYPSWSEQDFIRDYSRPAGPSQFHVMRDPKRYHEMYVTFKKLANNK